MGPPGAAAKPADPAKTAAMILIVGGALTLVGMISKNWISANAGSRGKMHIGPLGAEACGEGICVEIPLKGMDGDIELFMTLGMISGFAAAALALWFGIASYTGKRDKLLPAKVPQIAFLVAGASLLLFIIRVFSEGGHGVGPGWAMFVGLGGIGASFTGLQKLRPFLPVGSATAGTYPVGAAAGFSQPQNPYGQPGPYGQAPQNYGQAPQNYGQPPQAQQYGQPQQNPSGGWPPGGGAPAQPNAQQSQPMQPYGQQPPAQQSQPMQPYGQQPPAQQSQPMPPQQAAPNCPRCGQPLQFVAQYQRWFCGREQQYV